MSNFIAILGAGVGVVGGLLNYGYWEKRRERLLEEEIERDVEKNKNAPFCLRHPDEKMQRRNGSRGEFWGCPRYPYCKLTKSIEK